MKGFALFLFCLFGSQCLNASPGHDIVVDVPVRFYDNEPEIFKAQVSEENEAEFFLKTEQLIHVIEGIKRPVPLPLRVSPKDYLSLSELRELGFYVFYDERQVEINLALPYNSSDKSTLNLTGRSQVAPEGKPIPVSESSGYVNVGLNAGYRRDDHPVFLPDPASARFDGVLNIKDYILEAGGVSRDHQPFQRDDIRLTKELGGNLRLVLGDLGFPVRGFQTYKKVGGFLLTTAWRDREGFLGSRVSGRLLEIKQTATVSFSVNNNVINTRRLFPGVYDITEIPLVAGDNVIKVTIAQEGTDLTEVLYFNEYTSDFGLKEGTQDFSIGLGNQVADTSTARQYLSAERSALFSHRYDYSNKFSNTQYYEADRVVYLLGDISTFVLPGGYGEVDVAGSVTNQDSGLALRAGYFKTAPDRFTLLKGDHYNFNLEKRFKGFQSVGDFTTTESLRFSTNYSFPPMGRVSLNLGGSFFQQERAATSVFSYSAGASTGMGNFSTALSASNQVYSDRPDNLTLTYSLNWFPGDATYNLSSVSTAQGSQSFQLGVSPNGDSNVRGSISESRDTQSVNYSAQVSGATNRAEFTVNSFRSESRNSESHYLESFNFNTRFSLAFVDGVFAAGRPIGDSFLLTTSPHEDKVFRVESWGRACETGPLGEALLGFGSADLTTVKVFTRDLHYSEQSLFPTQVLTVPRSYRRGYLLTVEPKVSMLAVKILVADPTATVNKTIKLQNLKTGEESEYFVSADNVFYVEGIDVGDYLYFIDHFSGSLIISDKAGEEITLDLR